MIVLASASPRRRRLLRESGIPHRVLPTGVDESVPPGFAPEKVALTLAERKARAAAGRAEGWLVLGADTVVALDGEIIEKPVTPDRAKAALLRLSGRTHSVFTGLFLLDPDGGRWIARVVRTDIEFRPIAEGELDRYVAGGEPLDKAGGYGIQGAGREFVRDLRGPLDNVVGLPVDTLREMIEDLS